VTQSPSTAAAVALARCLVASFSSVRLCRRELELELIQTHMTQKPMLRVEVGAVFCSRCACVAHKGHARENRGRVQARRARRLAVCIRVCDSDSLVIMKKLLCGWLDIADGECHAVYTMPTSCALGAVYFTIGQSSIFSFRDARTPSRNRDQRAACVLAALTNHRATPCLPSDFAFATRVSHFSQVKSS
jgi:hypothetical protein